MTTINSAAVVPLVLVTLLLLSPAVGLPQSQQPSFKGRVDLLRVDVAAVADDGSVVWDLEAADFDVEVNGRSSPVTTLQFLDLRASPEVGAARPTTFSTNNTTNPGRLTVIAIDAGTLSPGRERALLQGVSDFVGKMSALDRTALLVFPNPSGKGRSVEFTSDVTRIQSALLRISAESRVPVPSPVQGIVRHELTTLAKTLAGVEGPKTLILIAGGVPDDYASVTNFANEAARARLTVYAIRPLEGRLYQADTREGIVATAGEDGLHMLVGDTGGAAFDAIGKPVGVLDRIARETAGLYVLGVQPPADVSGARSAKVSVKVKRRGVTVRSPTQVFQPAVAKAARDGKAAVEGLIQQPRLKTDIALRTAAYTVRETSGQELKTLVMTEVGQDADLDGLAWGYEVRLGEKVVARAFDRRVGRADRAADRGLLSDAVAIAPGAYTLRLAVVMPDGRSGSVEHAFVAGLHDAAAGVGLQSSDLFAGRAIDGRFVPAMTIPSADGAIAASVELYERSAGDAGSLAVSFALEDDREQVVARAPGHLTAAGSGKWKAQALLKHQKLAPGRYTILAEVVAARKPALTLRHSIIVS